MAAKKAPPKPKAARTRKDASVSTSGRSARAAKLAERTEENLTPKQRDRADRFIREYLRDFNGMRACIRMMREEGKEFEEISQDYATNLAVEMLKWPYIAFEIQRLVEQRSESIKEIVTEDEILYGLKREAYSPLNKGSTRAACWTSLAKLKGMGEPKKPEGAPGTARGGVMILPPTMPLEDWEAQAAEAQARLKEEVRQ